MHPALVPMLGPAGRAGFTLVASSILNAPASLSRAQLAASATALGPDGLAWQSFGSHAPRFAGAPRRLLIEGQRTNSVRNPRGEGALAGVVGSGGALPTNWTQSRVPELTITVIGAVTVDGLPGVRVRIAGTTAPGGGWALIEFEAAANIPAAPSQAWAGSLFWRLAAGSVPAGTVSRVFVSGRNASNAEVVANIFSTTAAPAAALSRIIVPATLTGDATLARINHRAAWTFAASTAVDMTLDLCAPQLEQAAFASTPILPPAGAPAASTRGVDLLSASLASLGIGANGACTVLWSGVIPQPAPGGAALASQFIACLDNGTDASRFVLGNLSGGPSVAVGANASFSAIGTMTPGTPFRAGCSIDGAGRIAGSFNGNAVVAQTGGPTAGLTTLRIGNSASGNSALFGETALLRVVPGAMSDAALQAQVAALS